MVYVLTPTDDPPRVAFAVGRPVGSAVVRNRVRRRLRAALIERRSGPQGLPPGAYLLSATPEAATMSYEELNAAVAGALDAIAEGSMS
jgi:ribonuclease P protein component